MANEGTGIYSADDIKKLPKKKKEWTADQIESVRMYFIKKGWISKCEIHLFVVCGRDGGRRIYDEIVKEIHSQGKHLPLSNMIPINTVIESQGLTQYKKYLR